MRYSKFVWFYLQGPNYFLHILLLKLCETDLQWPPGMEQLFNSHPHPVKFLFHYFFAQSFAASELFDLNRLGAGQTGTVLVAGKKGTTNFFRAKHRQTSIFRSCHFSNQLMEIYTFYDQFIQIQGSPTGIHNAMVGMVSLECCRSAMFRYEKNRSAEKNRLFTKKHLLNRLSNYLNPEYLSDVSFISSKNFFLCNASLIFISNHLR